MTDQELTNLRRELARIEGGRGRGYPLVLRARMARWARGRRGTGVSWKTLGRDLGVSAESLRRWTLLGADAEQAEMRPVEMVADTDLAPSDRRCLRVVTRGGHRIEDLSLVEAIEIVRVLG